MIRPRTRAAKAAGAKLVGADLRAGALHAWNLRARSGRRQARRRDYAGRQAAGAREAKGSPAVVPAEALGRQYGDRALHQSAAPPSSWGALRRSASRRMGRPAWLETPAIAPSGASAGSSPW